MLNSLKNKNVILITPKFFGYENYIYDELKKSGAFVTLICGDLEEVNYFFRFFRAFLKVFRNLVNDIYYFIKLKKHIKSADIVLVVRGVTLTKKIVLYMKKNVKISCKFCMYQWDSVKNMNGILDIVGEFDQISTFDSIDAKTYNWKYRPLFFIPTLTKNIKKENDILFIGSLHSKRVEIFNKTKEFCKKYNFSIKAFLYSKLMIYYRKKYLTKTPDYVNAKKEDLIFKPLSIKECYDLYSKSKVVIDFGDPNQTGLTMRSIEAIGNKCKLVTNNKNVINEKFYDAENIFIYDENFDIPIDFIKVPYKEIDEKIINNYSIKSWLEDILDVYKK